MNILVPESMVDAVTEALQNELDYKIHESGCAEEYGQEIGAFITLLDGMGLTVRASEYLDQFNDYIRDNLDITMPEDGEKDYAEKFARYLPKKKAKLFMQEFAGICDEWKASITEAVKELLHTGDHYDFENNARDFYCIFVENFKKLIFDNFQIKVTTDTMLDKDRPNPVHLSSPLYFNIDDIYDLDDFSDSLENLELYFDFDDKLYLDLDMLDDGQLADAISDETGWLVDSVDALIIPR